MAKVFCGVTDVIENYSGHARTVLDYCQLMTELVQAAKQPGFSQRASTNGWTV